MNYDKNSKKIIIPEGVTYIPEDCFKDNTMVEEIVLPSTLTHIGAGAFCGCNSLKKINLPEGLKVVDAFSFAGCSSLEEITFPKSLRYIDTGLFSECINLKTLNLHDDITYIDDHGLYNCHNLINFSLPRNLTSLGEMALSGCDNIKSIYIPSSLTNIECGALSLMHSLEEIVVDKNNPKYISDKNIALIEKDNGFFIQYAINCKEKGYEVGVYPIYYGDPDDEETLFSESSIYNISDYAFAGCNNLEELRLLSSIESFGCKTFFDCPNLKKLTIGHAPYNKVLLLSPHGFNKDKAYAPFEEIIIEDGITTLAENMNIIFKNALSVKLPSTLLQIGSNVFSQAIKLKSLMIPKKVKTIAANTFYEEIDLFFENIGLVKAKDFNMLETKTSNDFYMRTLNRDNIRIFSLSNGTYYVNIDDFEMVEVTKEEIRNLSNSSHLLENNPDTFINYLYKLLSINSDYHHMFINVLRKDSLREKFEKFISDIDYVSDIATKKNNKAIRDILEEQDLKDEFLFNGIVMKRMSMDDIVTIISNMNRSLERFFKFSNYFCSEQLNRHDRYFELLMGNIHRITSYCNLLEKYGQYDRFLYDPIFEFSLNEDEKELFISHFNSNLKRLFIHSEILKRDNYNDENMSDLIKFCQILGVFSDDEILSQKACNFIVEKIFTNEDENYRIIGNDIHRIFNEIVVRKQLDLEFVIFFVENYKELIDIEKTTSGFIARVYNNFREISNSSTSHKGEQRHLKVTVNKCKDYFLMNKFSEVDEEDKDLARLLGKYFADIEVLKSASLILKEASKAPRNIFTKIINCDGLITYDNNPDLDISGRIENGFYYEWLPKQSMDNLVLGKYCSCCSHVNGAGAGIMRASMVLDNCQNLVIRNDLGEIIAKATIYVDRENGYGVFNTIEGNLSFRNENQLKKIYDAYMAGCNTFIDMYNKNNPERPLHTITVGTKRNILANYFGQDNNVIPPLKTINYSTMGYEIGDRSVGKYIGDSSENQKYVFVKTKNKTN